MDGSSAELKVFYNLDDINCVAKGGSIGVTLLGTGGTVGRLDLRPCLVAATARSPELLNDKQSDYSVYTLDATEASGDFFEGHGLLSWNMADQHTAGQVTGRLRTDLAGQQVIEVRLQLKKAPAASQDDFLKHMATYNALTSILPQGFDHASWSDLLRQAASVVNQPQIMQQAQSFLSNPTQFAALPSGSLQDQQVQQHPLMSNGNGPRSGRAGKSISNGVTTLHKVREQKARELARGSSTMQNMSAQLQQARQQSATQKHQAQRIVQQAVAAQRQQQQRLALPRSQSENEMQAADFPSPLLPTPSSPPQMRTFAPPPAANAAASSLPPTRAPSLGAETPYALPEMQRSSSAASGGSGQKRKASNRLASRSPKVLKREDKDSKRKSTPMDALPASSMAAAEVAARGETTAAIVAQANAAAEAATQSTRQALSDRQDAEMIAALREGRTPKFCGNCGAIQTRGYWRTVQVGEESQTLCNPCGVYYKTKNVMRPEKLWQQHSARLRKQEEARCLREKQMGNKGRSNNAGRTSEDDHQEPVHFTRTSPARPEGMDATCNAKYRAVQSSPARQPPHSCTPTQALAELPVNTPSQPSPSPNQSAAADQARENLAALLRTPRRPGSSASKLLSCGSASPWRSMFTTFTEDSPSRQKFDKILEELALQEGQGQMTPSAAAAAAAVALVAASPSAQGLLDFSAMFGSPSRGTVSGIEGSPSHAAGMQAGLFNLASFMSSPPSMGNFTSEPLMLDETQTPDQDEGVQLPTPLADAAKQNQGKEANTPSSSMDGLFTPKRSTRHTKTPSSITRRALRSAGSVSNLDAFGGRLH